MKKLLICSILVFASGSAIAQTEDSAAATTAKKTDVKAEVPFNTYCLRDTGSRIPPTEAEKKATTAAGCARGPGRSYSKQDLDRTGAIDTADALRQLDPSLTIHRH